MDLYIVRHAWAGQFGDPQWPDDRRRPLTEEGKERFAVLAALLAERGMKPTRIAASPMVRCLETARLLAKAMSSPAEVVEREELLPDGNVESLLAWTAKQVPTQSQIAWVGHAPDVGFLTLALIGNPSGSLRFAKGAVAAVRFDGKPQLGAGELRWLVTAKMLGC
ncbi:MAG: histidine phosphatase family protein [Pirellulales bacterium]|nr:histidine phosphatase family protein [Pirellulales bacterium]